MYMSCTSSNNYKKWCEQLTSSQDHNFTCNVSTYGIVEVDDCSVPKEWLVNTVSAIDKILADITNSKQ